MLNRRQLLRACAVVSPGVLFKAASGQAQSPAFSLVKDKIQSAIRQGKATGVSLAVVSRGNIVWEESFGFADAERSIASTSHTSYGLASITKPFTATLVASLMQQERLSLDSAAMPYLAASPLRGPNGDPQSVTVRMLGAHCSGLPGTFAAHLLGGSAPAQSTKGFLNDYGHLAYPPGQIYEYGNIGFEALGAIAEELTGQPLGRLMQEYLIRPLALRDSFFSATGHRRSSAATGYDDAGEPIAPYETSTPPSGELYASVHDLARFLLFCLRGQHGAVRDTTRKVFRGSRGVDTTFGWFTGTLSTGSPYFFKSGGQPGVAAKVFFLPSADVGCAVLTNRTDNMPLVEDCCRSILRHSVPDFEIPEEDAGPGSSSSFGPTPDFIGDWRGTLVNGGADQAVRFSMSADGNATLALSERKPEPVTNMQGSSPGFEGTTKGLIDCVNAAEFGERMLELKLIPHRGKLIGRITARGARPGLLLANIPYVLMLDRVHA